MFDLLFPFAPVGGSPRYGSYNGKNEHTRNGSGLGVNFARRRS